MTSQVIYLATDLDPVPIAARMAADWCEIVVERVGVDERSPVLAGWRWRITGRLARAQ
jgi:hypothetical protein